MLVGSAEPGPRVVLALVVALASGPAPGAAQDGRTADGDRRASAVLAGNLSWEAPPGCPGRQAVLDRLDALVPDGAAPRRGVGELAPTGTVDRPAGTSSSPTGAYRLILRATPDAAPRVVRAAACADLVDAAAVILALLAFDLEPSDLAVGPPKGSAEDGEAPGVPAEAPEPEAPEPGPGGPGPRQAGPPAAAEEPGPRDANQATAPAEGDRGPGFEAWRRVLGSVGLALDAGPLPSVGVGPSLGLGAIAGFRRVDVDGRLELRFQPAQDETSITPAGSVARGTFRLFSATVTGCVPLLALGPVRVAPCGSVDLGVVWGEGSGVSDPGSGRAFWADVGLGAQMRWWVVGPLALRLDGALAVVPRRPDFVVELDGGDGVRVHRAGRVAGRVVLAAEVILPVGRPTADLRTPVRVR